MKTDRKSENHSTVASRDSAPLSCRAVTPSAEYLNRCRELLDTAESQQAAIQQAADWFAATILAGRMVHLFGSGHSRILVEEMWPRYGSFPGFNPDRRTFARASTTWSSAPMASVRRCSWKT